jgi:hypothetical protein
VFCVVDSRDLPLAHGARSRIAPFVAMQEKKMWEGERWQLGGNAAKS